tara:strand:- start:5873 stop:6052 length:180 start_codon:yes stop_codon:yes gene_type:complete
MTIEEGKEKLSNLRKSLKTTEQTFYKIQGAIEVLEQEVLSLIEKEENSKKESLDKDKKK